jgi:hypothetical protein
VRRAILIMLVVAAFVVGCGGDSKSVAIGWKAHQVDDGGFSIETPAAWLGIREFDTESLDEFIEANPQFAPFKDAMTGGLIKFFAHDPDLSDDFATNVNVTVHALGTKVSLSEYARVSAAVARDLNAVDVRTSIATLPAGRCVRLTFEHQVQAGNALKWLAVLQYALLHRGSEYVLTFTTLPALRDRYRTTFTRSARSFRFD